MGKGQAMMLRLSDALTAFEAAVTRREHRRVLESKVPLQQEVDHARQRVVDVVVDLVRSAEKERAGSGSD